MRNALPKRPVRRAGILCLFLLLAASTLPVSVAAKSPFRVEKLTDGIYLYRPADSDYTRTNSLVVERHDGLLVVDAQPTPGAARELLAEIARRHSAPVRYLVYSHAHTESTGGGTAFPKATLVIASENCRAEMTDAESDLGAEMKARTEDPETWAEPERRPPVLATQGTISLDDPVHPINLIVLGRRTHTDSDLMLHMPAADLYHVGGLLFSDRNPYATDANMRYWLNSFNHLISERPEFVVGLRGPVITRAEMMEQRDALAWVRGQVEEGFIKMLPLNRIEDRVMAVEGLGERFDLETDPSFVFTVIHRTVEEGAEARRKRGRPFKEREVPESSESP